MNKVLLSAAAITIIILASYFLFKVPTQTLPSPTPTPTIEASPSPSPTPQTVTHPVTYTNSGYSPKSIIIKVGDTVSWLNNSTRNVWTASAMHPSHTNYSGTSLQQHCPDIPNTSFDQCRGGAPGTLWSFTFTKPETWNYHDHLRPSDFGTVIVE